MFCTRAFPTTGLTSYSTILVGAQNFRDATIVQRRKREGFRNAKMGGQSQRQVARVFHVAPSTINRLQQHHHVQVHLRLRRHVRTETSSKPTTVTASYPLQQLQQTLWDVTGEQYLRWQWYDDCERPGWRVDVHTTSISSRDVTELMGIHLRTLHWISPLPHSITSWLMVYV